MGITAVSQNQINQFVEENGITYPILQDEQSSGGSGPAGFGGETYDDYYIPNQGSPYPRDFIVDQDGILAYANNEIDTEYMIYIIEDLLAEESLQTDDLKIIPDQIIIYPVYPNPFNPVTTIRFDIPNVEMLSEASLHVFDLNGRMVETLVEGVKEPGIHEIQWNAGHNTSGIYFARLKSGSKIQSQKLILLK